MRKQEDTILAHSYKFCCPIPISTYTVIKVCFSYFNLFSGSVSSIRMNVCGRINACGKYLLPLVWIHITNEHVIIQTSYIMYITLTVYF